MVSMGGAFVVGFFDSGQMGGTGVLDFGGIDWDTLVDDWHVDTVFVDILVRGVDMFHCVSVVTVFKIEVSIVMGIMSLGVGGQMSSLGVLNFGGINWDAIDWQWGESVVIDNRAFVDSVVGGLGMGGKVFSLGVFHIVSFDWVSMVIDFSVWSMIVATFGVFVSMSMMVSGWGNWDSVMVDILWQICSCSMEAEFWVSGVLDGLVVSIGINIGVFTVNDSVS
jgi:hypothetical protein